MKKYIAFAVFAATVPAANWLIGNVGTECVPQGPCLIPMGFGFMAPSGVLMIGAALVLRDWLHELVAIGDVRCEACGKPANTLTADGWASCYDCAAREAK